MSLIWHVVLLTSFSPATTSSVPRLNPAKELSSPVFSPILCGTTKLEKHKKEKYRVLHEDEEDDLSFQPVIHDQCLHLSIDTERSLVFGEVNCKLTVMVQSF